MWILASALPLSRSAAGQATLPLWASVPSPVKPESLFLTSERVRASHLPGHSTSLSLSFLACDMQMGTERV